MGSSPTAPESLAPFSSTCLPGRLPVPHCPVSHLSTLSIPPTPCDGASSRLPGPHSLHERFQKAKADWRWGWAGGQGACSAPHLPVHLLGLPPGPRAVSWQVWRPTELER